MPCRIRPALRQVWRDVGRLQLGVDARHAVVLDGLTAADELLLADLDGRHERQEVLARAVARGHGAERGEALLALLEDAGALEPDVRRPGAAPPAHLAADAAALSLLHPDGDGWDVLARRRRTRVVVLGTSRVALAVATGLQEAAVGLVELVDDDDAAGAVVGPHDVAPDGHRVQDVGRRRARSAADALERASHQRGWQAPEDPSRPGISGRAAAGPDLVVLASSRTPAPSAYEPLLRDDVPHLAVAVGERSAVVGPLVLPGRSACLRCLDLHRTDRDPQWPAVAAQLCAPGPHAAPEPLALARLAAALAVPQVLTYLDSSLEVGADGPAAVDTTWEIDLGDGLPSARTWGRHPRCGCAWPSVPDGHHRVMMGR